MLEGWLMKIKLDFITNSSSTAYVIMIPPNLKMVTSVDELGLNWDEDTDDKDKAINLVNENISTLKQGNTLYAEDVYLYCSTQDYLLEKGLEIASIEISSDGGGTLEPVRPDKIFQILDKYNDENKT
jgi:hypothetical protein